MHKILEIFDKAKALFLSSLFVTTIIFVAHPNKALATYCMVSKEQVQYCSNKTVCEYTDSSLRGSIARAEAKRRGLTCKGVSYKAGSTAASPLRKIFTALSTTNRIQIQSKLLMSGHYSGSIDGLYGNRTAAAIQTYQDQNLPSLKLNSERNIRAVLRSILTSQIPSTPNVSEFDNETEYMVSSGTGFLVSEDGHIITNYHVVEGCNSVEAAYKGKKVPTEVVAYDELNDLAALKANVTPEVIVGLSNDDPYPMQDLIVAGYPFGENFSSTIKFTKGIVSSLAGLGNNYSQIQIDAALQPGNSGGPILDEKGNAIAVAVAKLSISHVLKNYGVVPENTNFGVKVSAVKNLLNGNGIEYAAPNKDTISKQSMAQDATDATLYLTCWMNGEQIYRMEKQKLMFAKFKQR